MHLRIAKSLTLETAMAPSLAAVLVTLLLKSSVAFVCPTTTTTKRESRLQTSGLVGPTTSLRRPTKLYSAEEVSVAATQQLVALGVVGIVEGLWSTKVAQFTGANFIRYAVPNLGWGALLFAASTSVSTGVADQMVPGLAVSIIASLGMCYTYSQRLGTTVKPMEDAPPKEVAGLLLAIAFFGFSVAFQSLFAIGILENPFNFLFDGGGSSTGVPDAFPDMSQGAVRSD